MVLQCAQEIYRKISNNNNNNDNDNNDNIRRTKSPNLKASRLVLQLSLPNPIKPGVKSIMKM